MHINAAQEVLGNHSSTSIMTSSLMIDKNSFLVVTNTHTTTVNRAEFKLLMDSLNIRLDIQNTDYVQNLFITKNLGQTLVTNKQDSMPRACFVGSDGVFLATSLITVTNQVKEAWRKLLSLAKLLPQIELLSRAGSCVEKMNINSLDLKQLFQCTKVIIVIKIVKSVLISVKHKSK